MSKPSIIRIKSFEFAVESIKLYKTLLAEKEYILSKQFIRAATSVGANVAESTGAQSNRDFLHKLSIAYKEARETEYWLELLNHFRPKDEITALSLKANEICRILNKITTTLENKLKN